MLKYCKFDWLIILSNIFWILLIGFFIQKGKLDKSDIQLIEVKDFMSFVAVKKTKIPAFFRAIKEEKMKGKKYKIEVLR